ncbi:MAG: hypothetical protein ISQ73_13725 [Verrucomicrobiae bacterium]|nr:hypothetical protein [Verrucomicrobiae bacterium]
MSTNNPFPGLRPFNYEDNHLFFGRDEQITDLASRLRKNRFVAVVGTSGSGKSSLVRAGLLPELYGGTMTDAGSRWQTAVMRPGGDPIQNLAQALINTDLYDPDEEDIELQVTATLTRSGLGMLEAIRQSDIEEGENFLLVVDQFEEIFRFRKAGDVTDERAMFFVNLLIEAVNQSSLPIYVIITMRSDFLGECSEFPRLANMVNEGEFLIPRLNREQRKQTIVGPVKVSGGEITDPLLSRLLNDIGDDPDQLPILQHALMRTWEYTNKEAGETVLDLKDYRATGGMQEALSRHADEIFDQLPSDKHRWIAERVFKSLTEKVDTNRGIRRPITFSEICEIVQEKPEDIELVIQEFRSVGRTFLMPAEDTAISASTVIDISHESLMRVWFRLRKWVEDEAQSAKIYRRLAETTQLFLQGKAGLYRNPDLEIAIAWKKESQPSKVWAERYFPGFQDAMDFLQQSHAKDQAEKQAKEKAQQRELENANSLVTAQKERAEALRATARRRKHFSWALGMLAFGLLLITFYSIALRNEAVALRDEAEKLKDDAIEGKEQVRKNFFVTQLAQVDHQVQQQHFQKALQALKVIKPENALESRLTTTRLLSSVSDTFFPRKQAELYQLGKRAIFPNGGVISKSGRYVCIGADYDGHGNVHVVDLQNENPELHFTQLESVLKAEYNYARNLYAVGYKFQGSYFTSVFDVQRGLKMELDLELKSSPVKVNFDQAGNWLAVVSLNGEIHLADCRSNNLKPIQIIASDKQCLHAAFSPDAQVLYLFSQDSSDQYVETFRLSQGKWQRESGVAISLSDDKLAFIHSEWSKNSHEIIIYGNTDTQKPILQCMDAKTLRIKNRVDVSNYHKSGGINTLLLSHDGTMVISPCMDNTCSVSDYETGALKYKLQHSANVYFARLSPNQQMLMVGDWLGFRLWDPYSGKPLTSYVKLGEGMRGAQFLEEGKILRIVTMNANVFDYEISGLPPQQQKIKDTTSSLAVNDGASLILGHEGSLSAWAETDGAYRKHKELSSFEGTSHIIRGSSDNNIAVVDYRYPEQSHISRFALDDQGTLESQPDLAFPITSLSNMDLEHINVSPDGKFLAYPEENLRVINFYSMETGKKLKELEYPYSISSIEFSRDHKSVLIFGTPDLISVIDLKTLKIVNELKHLTRYGGCIRFDRTGRLMASFGSGEKKGMLWSYENSENIVLLGEFSHASGICALDFGVNSQIMATASQDGMVRIWDLSAPGQSLPLKRQIQQDREIAAVQFIGDEHQTLLTCDEEASVRIWDLDYVVVEAGPFKMGESEVPQNGAARYEFDLFGKVFGQGNYVSIIARGSPLMIQKLPKLSQESALSGTNLVKTIEMFTGWGGESDSSLSVEQLKKNQIDVSSGYENSLITQYLNWYTSKPSNRSVTPFQNIPLKTFVEDNLSSEDLFSISQILRLDPGNPSALAKFGQLYLMNANHGSLEKRTYAAAWYASKAASLSRGNSVPNELTVLRDMLEKSDITGAK